MVQFTLNASPGVGREEGDARKPSRAKSKKSESATPHGAQGRDKASSEMAEGREAERQPDLKIQRNKFFFLGADEPSSEQSDAVKKLRSMRIADVKAADCKDQDEKENVNIKNLLKAGKEKAKKEDLSKKVKSKAGCGASEAANKEALAMIGEGKSRPEGKRADRKTGAKWEPEAKDVAQREMGATKPNFVRKGF